MLGDALRAALASFGPNQSSLFRPYGRVSAIAWRILPWALVSLIGLNLLGLVAAYLLNGDPSYFAYGEIAASVTLGAWVLIDAVSK